MINQLTDAASASRIVAIPNFRSSILNNERDLQVYLPPGYETARDHRYPVLYLHDGQHAFHSDHRGSSWDIHLTVDRLIAEGRMKPILIVAVAHIADARIAEYMHTVPGSGEAYGIRNEGEQYERFLIEEVMPYINGAFRTLLGPAHTAMMGSSAGGLVSYNIGFRRPDIFGMIGALCPFFVKPDPQMGEESWFSKIYRDKPSIKLWMDVGEAEGFTVMERHVRHVTDTMLASGFRSGQDLMYALVPGSGHAQKDWAARVHAPLLYFFGEIGRPVRVALLGSEDVGLVGPRMRLNPMDHYDSGFFATNLAAVFEVGDSTVLKVTRDGTVEPLREGETTVTYRQGPLTATKRLRVVPELPEKVKVVISVDVPVDTPAVDMIYAGIELPRSGPHQYGGTFMLPRDFAVEFRIALSMGTVETDEQGEELPFRSFRAQDGLVLHYQVKNWREETDGGH